MPVATTIVNILWRYKNQEDLSDQELSELRKWLEQSPDHEDLFDDLSNSAKWDKEIAPLLAKDSNASWKKIQERVKDLSEPEIVRSFHWRPYAAAAALIILLGATFFIWRKRIEPRRDEMVSNRVKINTELYPVKFNASLTLDDGKVISLDSARTGDITYQGKTRISKPDSNSLNYRVASNRVSELKFNTLATGRGSLFQLTLPDGSKVWLGSGTRIRFPVAFAGIERTVELSGEAYFEVAKNIEKPFIVKTAYSSVRVLGTHFNINAYPEEHRMKTTLLEGSVLISNGKDSVLIKPGQQAESSIAPGIEINSANVQQVIAWRNRLFWFQQTPFEEIMMQVSRQYDIEVIYKAGSGNTFSGILPQNLPLSGLLDLLEKGGNVHFRTEGKKITVRP
jgi:transmembrane sensor